MFIANIKRCQFQHEHSFNWFQIRGDAYEGGCLGPRGARVFLFFGFVLGFASVIAACWILFANFVNKGM